MIQRRRWMMLRAFGIIIALIGMLFPVYWMFKSALETQLEIFHAPPYLFPPAPSLDALIAVFPVVAPTLAHSLIIAIGCVVLTTALAAPAGFALAHLNLRGGAVVLLILLLATTFPSIMYLTPLFLTYYHLGLLNSYLGVILADSTYSVPLAVIIIYTYMRTLPLAVIEAALIDGASLWTAFAVIIVPIAVPGIVTGAIFAFLAGWGDFIFALTLTSGQQIMPASIAVYTYISGEKQVSWNLALSAAVYLAIPVAIALIIAQRFITAGLSAGALKG